MKKLIPILAALTLFVTMLTGCAKTSTSPDPTASAAPSPTVASTATKDPMTVTDFLNRTVTLKAVPKKIVSLTPSNTELIYALGLQDRLVGVDAFSNYPAETASLPKVGDFNGPNIENIIALEPDLILAGNKLQQETIQKLVDKNLPVISAEATRYEEIYKSIDMISSLCGISEKGEALKAEMRGKEAQIKKLAEGKSSPSIYYVLSFGEYGDYTIGSGNFITDLFTMAGVNVVTKNYEVPWPKYSVEQLITDNPMYLVCDSYLSIDDLKKTTGYKELSAVKNNNILVANSDKMSRPAVRCLDEMLELAKKFYQ